MLQPDKRQNYSIVELLSIASVYVVTLYLTSYTIFLKNIPFPENHVSKDSIVVLD